MPDKTSKDRQETVEFERYSSLAAVQVQIATSLHYERVCIVRSRQVFYF